MTEAATQLLDFISLELLAVSALIVVTIFLMIKLKKRLQIVNDIHELAKMNFEVLASGLESLGVDIEQVFKSVAAPPAPVTIEKPLSSISQPIAIEKPPKALPPKALPPVPIEKPLPPMSQPIPVVIVKPLKALPVEKPAAERVAETTKATADHAVADREQRALAQAQLKAAHANREKDIADKIIAYNEKLRRPKDKEQPKSKEIIANRLKWGEI